MIDPSDSTGESPDEPTLVPADEDYVVLPGDAEERTAALEALVPEVTLSQPAEQLALEMTAEEPDPAPVSGAEADITPDAPLEPGLDAAQDAGEGEDAAADEPVTADEESGDEVADDEAAEDAAGDTGAETLVAQEVAPVDTALSGFAGAAGIEGAQIAQLPASVPWWPFLSYAGAWLVLASAAAYFLITRVPADTPVYESPAYTYTVLGGIALTVAGPILIIAVWLAEWFRRGDRKRSGLFLSSLVKGSAATLFGAIVWWVALVVVDAIRLGRPL